MLSLTGNPLFVHQWAPRHARGAAVCTSVWQIPVKWLCSGTEDTFTVTLTCFVFSTKLPVPGTLIRALSLLTHVLSSPCKASKTRCSAGCSDVQQPHPARLPTSCSSVASLALTRSTSLSTVKFICRGNHAIQEVARMQQLIATSVVAGSQRASHYHSGLHTRHCFAETASKARAQTQWVHRGDRYGFRNTVALSTF